MKSTEILLLSGLALGAFYLASVVVPNYNKVLAVSKEEGKKAGQATAAAINTTANAILGDVVLPTHTGTFSDEYVNAHISLFPGSVSGQSVTPYPSIPFITPAFENIVNLERNVFKSWGWIK